MSLSLGQANNYINNIENRKTLPSMQSFFYICEYLGITPEEFFDEGNSHPYELNEFIREAKQLNSESMACILGIKNIILCHFCQAKVSYYDYAYVKRPLGSGIS